MKYLIKVIILALPILLFSQRFGSAQASEEPEKQNLLPMMPETEIETKSTILEVPIEASTFLVGPGDKFSISIDAGETLSFVSEVTPGGGILVPKVGNINVAWKTLEEAKTILVESITQQYRQSKVTVDLVGLREILVPVTGAVLDPGYFKSSPIRRVSDLIEKANPNPLADLTAVSLVDMHGEVRVLNMILFTSEGDVSNNPTLNNGDRIHIPMVDVSERAIVVRGAVEESGYFAILQGETLESVILRSIAVQANADIENIKVIRKVGGTPTFYTVTPEEFDSFVLQGGDEVEVSNELPVNVIGQVEEPGSFVFIPGYTSSDYISLAGGILPSGASKGVKVIRKNGEVLRGNDVLIQRGDIIEVNRSLINLMIGDISILQFASTVATLVLAYSAVN